MCDGDRVDRFLVGLRGVAEARAAILPGFGDGPRAEDMGAAVDGLEARERRPQAVRKRLPGRVHRGKERVAAQGRHLPGIQRRTQRGNLVVGVVGVPGTADIGFLFGLLPDLSDLGITLHGREEAVDVDRRQGTGEGQVLLG